MEKKVNGQFWRRHHKSWFGFTVPAKFVEHADGGFFASRTIGDHLFSVARNGFTEPG